MYGGTFDNPKKICDLKRHNYEQKCGDIRGVTAQKLTTVDFSLAQI